MQLLTAVAYVHGQGVVHNDVTPVNVLVDRTHLAPWPPRLTLTDFGLAKALGPGAVGAAGAQDVWGVGAVTMYMGTGKTQERLLAQC